MRRPAVLACLCVALATLAGCAAGPGPRATAPQGVASRAAPLGAQAAEQARALVGAPYRYGGIDPAGFDCSGLVWYVYQQLGIELPRRSVDQRRGLPPIARDELAPGDLVFFSTPADHVGIYLGGGDFVHAPRTGKRVSVASLDTPYFQLGYAGAARVPPP